jgi:hypothetical protein
MSISQAFIATLPHPSIVTCAMAHRFEGQRGALVRALRNTSIAGIRANLHAMGVACPRSREAAIVALAGACTLIGEHGYVPAGAVLS